MYSSGRATAKRNRHSIPKSRALIHKKNPVRSCRQDKFMFVLQNNGRKERLTNACLFISVHDYIRYVLNITDVTVSELRKVGMFPGGNSTLFDTDVAGHTDSLRRIADVYKLSVHFYGNHSPSGTFAGTCWKTVGNGQHHLSILAYGEHFELIVSETPKSKMLELNKLYKTEKRHINRINSIFPTDEKRTDDVPTVIEIVSTDSDNTIDPNDEVDTNDFATGVEDVHKIMSDDFKMLIDYVNLDIRNFLNTGENHLNVVRYFDLAKEINDAEMCVGQLRASLNMYTDQLADIENVILTLSTLLHDKTIDRFRFDADMESVIRNKREINAIIRQTADNMNTQNRHIEQMLRNKRELEDVLKPYFALMQTAERIHRHVLYLSK